MKRVIVYSSFPDATEAQRKEIYTWLQQRNWVIDGNCNLNQNDAIWHGHFGSLLTEDQCRRHAHKTFTTAYAPYGKARLVIVAKPKKADAIPVVLMN